MVVLVDKEDRLSDDPFARDQNLNRILESSEIAFKNALEPIVYKLVSRIVDNISKEAEYHLQGIGRYHLTLSEIYV